jgi:hypothetical protein
MFLFYYLKDYYNIDLNQELYARAYLNAQIVVKYTEQLQATILALVTADRVCYLD